MKMNKKRNQFETPQLRISSVTMQPKRGVGSPGILRARSGSVGAFETERLNSGEECGANAICGLAGLPGLPVLGGRRMSLSHDRWICPNDRQLALRAKLSMGWSTGQVTPPRQESLTEAETKAIMDVIRKAEELDLNEQERVGRLVQKVEKMKQKRLGNGTSTCILCGGNLPLLRTSSLLCADCSKGVCSKCGVEVPGGKDTLWLCKICSETREMWKRSGAWFFRGLPKHVIPPKPNSQGNGGVRKGKNTPRRWNTIGAKGSTSEDNETSSEDETRRKIRMQKSNTEVPEIDNHDITKTEINISTPRLNKPTGIPPLTPDPSSFPVPHPRSRSVSPKPMIIDLTGVKGGTDSSSEEKTFDKSPISPACLSPRDFHRTPSRESGGETGGFLTPRYCPSPSSSSPRNELKRDHAFDRSPSPLLNFLNSLIKMAKFDTCKSNNEKT